MSYCLSLAYAICQCITINSKNISFITQLLVHTAYRRRGIATEMLRSLFRLSKNLSWGIVSASPFAILALEKATHRKANPNCMRKHYDEIKKFSQKILYCKDKKIHIDKKSSYINTEYHINHEKIPEEIQWRLGDLPDGHEWLAITFADQPRDTGNSWFL